MTAADDDVPVPWWYQNVSAEHVERYRRSVRAQRTAKARRRQSIPEWEQMTWAERRGLIFALEADGATVAQIASQLWLSRAYVTDALKKIWAKIYRRADAKFPVGGR